MHAFALAEYPSPNFPLNASPQAKTLPLSDRAKL